MEFDRPTVHALPSGTQVRPSMTRSEFRIMVHARDPDAPLEIIDDAYQNVPPHARVDEFQTAVATAIRATHWRRKSMQQRRTQRVGATPFAVTYERREGGAQGQESTDPLRPTLG